MPWSSSAVGAVAPAVTGATSPAERLGRRVIALRPGWSPTMLSVVEIGFGPARR